MAIKNRWFMPTNTANLRMIVAQGLISSPSGFSKYYTDVLELFPGYVPLFKNEIQSAVLNSVVNEVSGLTPCLLEFNLKMLGGSVKAIVDNELRDIELKDVEKEIDKISLLLIFAPIPVSCISIVIFNTNKDKADFKNDAELYSNVPISDLELHYSKKDQKLFETVESIIDDPIQNIKNIKLDPVLTVNYSKTYAFGGMIANLFYFSKNGSISDEIFLSCCSQKYINNNPDLSSILEYFYTELNNNPMSDHDYLYKNILDIVVKRKDFKEGIIEFLISNKNTANIADKLKAFEETNDKPVSEEFNEATTLFGKVLLMLFYRDNTEALMDYSLDFFTEEDYFMFAVIFGARDKFIKLPKFFRNFIGLQNFISVIMANYAHENFNGEIKFKEPPPPMTLIEMLKNNRFKEYFSKKLKIENCFETIMPQSTYRVVKGKPVFDGVVMPKFKLLEEKYFNFMSGHLLTDYNTFVANYNKCK